MAALFGDVSGLTPHGFCLAWQPGLLWLQAASDAAIAVAYYSIPLALISLVRRRGDLAYPWMFALFAGFILACGSTHIMAVVTLWQPLYWIDAGLKALTALLSVITAALLWPLLPHALALPSPAQLRAVNHLLAQQVTERDAAVARLEHSEARHRALYARTPAALHTLDLEGRFIAVNEEWTAMLGYPPEEMLGQPLTRLFEPGYALTYPVLWRKLLHDGGMRDAERRVVCKDGRVLTLLVSATVEHDAEGRPLQVMSVLTDITARRATEAALRASEERLHQAQKMQAVGQLTGGIAHDFNNMLTVVMANLELLQRRLPDDDPRAARLARTAMAGAERAARLTSQLLSFSRQQRLEPQPLDPASVIDGVRDLLERTLSQKCRLQISEQSDAVWRCLADRNQLESALVNLVLNACAAMPDGGEISIVSTDQRLTAADLAATELQADEAPEPGDYVALSVQDTGHGMTEAVRRRAIEPFFTTKATGEGTGLGLSQIYGFMRQSGGALRITSAPGQGTRVDLLLPRARPEPPARRQDFRALAEAAPDAILTGGAGIGDRPGQPGLNNHGDGP